MTQVLTLEKWIFTPKIKTITQKRNTQITNC